MPNPPRIISIQVENLRGFESSYLPLERQLVIVGPNNAGKTSMLRILDLVFSAPKEVLDGHRPLSEEEEMLLWPAQDPQNKARRITLRVRVPDGRSHTRFRCANGIATLRIGVGRETSSGRHLRLNLAEPRRGESVSDPDAWTLLSRVRSAHAFVWIPASRDAASPRFRSFVNDAFRRWLDEAIRYDGQGRPREDYRQFESAVTTTHEIATSAVSRIAGALKSELPQGLVTEVRSFVDVASSSLRDWIADQSELRLSTGEHDSLGVAPSEVGSGLQSLLLLALQRAEQAGATGRRRLIMAVEEPESFLHPSLQRQITRRLLSQTATDVLLTTHSSQVVSEACYRSIIICRDHRFFAPRPDPVGKDAIDTVLMEDRPAEAFFAESILLVEGESERRFFEGIRRRLADSDPSGLADRMFVLDVGGRTRFGPWLRLLNGYKTESGVPAFRIICVVDADGTSGFLDGASDAGLEVTQEMRDRAGSLGSLEWDSADLRARRAQAVSLEISKLGPSVSVLPIDLEWSLFRKISPGSALILRRATGLQETDPEALAKETGSKFPNGHSSGKKSPWIKSHIAEVLGWQEISTEIRTPIQAWLDGARSPVNPAVLR